MTEQIAVRLREARKALFKRAADAADSLGVPYQTYAAHENGNRKFDIDSSVLYARRFKVSLDWLLTGQGRGPGGTESPIIGESAIRATLNRIDGLSDLDIDVVYSVIANALAVKRAAPEPSASGDPPPPASRPRARVPS